jgi:hypothetical protein
MLKLGLPSVIRQHLPGDAIGDYLLEEVKTGAA